MCAGASDLFGSFPYSKAQHPKLNLTTPPGQQPQKAGPGSSCPGPSCSGPALPALCLRASGPILSSRSRPLRPRFLRPCCPSSSVTCACSCRACHQSCHTHPAFCHALHHRRPVSCSCVGSLPTWTSAGSAPVLVNVHRRPVIGSTAQLLAAGCIRCQQSLMLSPG